MPPVVHHAIDVAATPDACWQAFADLSTWPRWFPMLRTVRTLDGAPDPWRIGGRFELTFALGLPVKLALTVEELEVARRVRWAGGRLGMAGNHYYTFEVKSPGLTRVTSHEEFTGPATRFLPRKIVERIDDEVHRSMEKLKALVEGR